MNCKVGKEKVSSKREWLISICSVLTVCLYPVIFLYAQNAYETHLSETLFPAALFSGIGLLLFFLLTLWNHREQESAIISAICMMAILNFSMLVKAMCHIYSNLRYWHCVLVLAFVLAHIGWLIHKKVPVDGAALAVRIISGVFGFLILLNLGMAMPDIVGKLSVKQKNEANRTDHIQVESKESLPNIYYIICDEYSGFETIKNIQGYDNEPFAQYLEHLGFSVSRDSYNDEIVTDVVTANLMALDYKVSYADSTAQETDAIRKNSELFKILKEKGYLIQGVGSESSTYGLKRADDGQSQTSSATIGGDNFREIVIKKTIAYPFLHKNVTELQENTLKAFKYLQDPSNFPEKGMFTLMHVCIPHVPFIFDENGGNVSQQNWANWTDPRYYLGQYIYCTKLLRDTVPQIIERDPHAIIILQSDHAARASADNSVFMRLIPYENMKNILNAVYFGGAEIEEIQGQSGVNTLRILLNKLFDFNYELLEVPYGSYEAYRKQAGL